MKDDILVIRLEKSVKKQLIKLAENEGRTLSNYVQHMIMQKVKATDK